ncbi:hypothetical protein CEXT_480701 [Caerostris extrusa]|uniref:Uncharacterized protein n=1 Tax=Caerostris extrusa TaxID=172846 RepID=A0AAV4P9F5_CAEEX|nr:hypothetical protein CEXT_480701 [Caerostris extrusa]
MRCPVSIHSFELLFPYFLSRPSPNKALLWTNKSQPDMNDGQSRPIRERQKPNNQSAGITAANCSVSVVADLSITELTAHPAPSSASCGSSR